MENPKNKALFLRSRQKNEKNSKNKLDNSEKTSEISVTDQTKWITDVVWVNAVENEMKLEIPINLIIYMNNLILNLVRPKKVSFEPFYQIIYCYALHGTLSTENPTFSSVEIEKAKPEYTKEQRIRLLKCICCVFCDYYPIYENTFKSLFMSVN